MNAPLSHSETKDILVREYDRRATQGAPSISDVASASGFRGSNLVKAEALLIDALIARGDLAPDCPDFIPAWVEREAAS